MVSPGRLPIGVFDSGLGGLTVVKQIRKILPRESIIYFGDTARVPYGTKSNDTILRFSIENVLFFLKHKVKIIIIACNTSSSVALSTLEKYFSVPIMGVIEPGAKIAAKKTRNKRIGVIGTQTTIKSQSYQKHLIKLDSGLKVFSKACPLFVPLVEEGRTGGKIVEDIAREYLRGLIDKNIDTLILGCTHYPILESTISKILGKKIYIVNSASVCASSVKDYLEKNKILSPNNKGFLKCYVSDDPEGFEKIGTKILGEKITAIITL
ncbi:glutamate racemase [bacterium Unc6]|nr:glutamate racemase [bacterium Unc6]